MKPQRNKSAVLLVVANYYQELSSMLEKGAGRVLDSRDQPYETIRVPGCLEIPTAISLSGSRFEVFVALGVVIRGETRHFDIVADQSARALADLGIHKNMLIGNGIIAAENKAQAEVRANPEKKDKGGEAARAALTLLSLAERVAENKFKGSADDN